VVWWTAVAVVRQRVLYPACTCGRVKRIRKWMLALVRQGRKRVFIRSMVLTSDAAIGELEERKRTKGQRQARRPRQVVVEAVPPFGAGGDDDNFQAGDDLAFEGWGIVAERALPP
jgi:hypothetical protein